ncbi:MAG: SDR family oxidoreductase [Brevundimonas sp.]|nr:SDR family oxidoreductase [Brevundimonas sp.]
MSDLPRRSLLTAAALAAPALASTAVSAQPAGQGRATGHAAGKVAIVTGSSRGIGAATARRLARDGYALTINYRVSRELAAQVVSEIEAAGGRAIAVQADVSDPAAVRRLFDETQTAFGGVDAVISNAGIMNLAPFAEMTDEAFIRMTDVNQKGSFFVLREAARRVRDGGRIVALNSSIVELRSPTYGPYAATKAAQGLFAASLAKEMGGRGITVNAVAPGVVNTPLFTDGKTPEMVAGFVARTPLGRLGEPTDIANVIAGLCGPDGGWISGQTVFANGAIV